MSNEEVLSTDILRARIMNVEYQNLSIDEIKREIKRIYIEETGKEPPAHINIYRSDDFKDFSHIDSGFDGTAIHFYDEEKRINQAYIITRGSEVSEKDTWKPLDWFYNTFGIFVGKDKSQYRDAMHFDEIVTKKIDEDLEKNKYDKKIKLKKIGLGHSLGGNLIVTIQLTAKEYEQVYVINDAPPSYYQLAKIDVDFWYDLAERFNLNPLNYNSIYTLSPSKLKVFAEEYYKKQIDERSIHHLTAQEDMLYAVSGARGFIDIGSRRVIDTNKDFTSIKDLVSKISDKDVKAIQVYLSQYSDVYNEKGFDEVVQAMTGVDIAFIESLQGYDSMDYVWHAGDIVSKANHMLDDMKVKIPELMKNVAILYKNLDPIFSVFVELGYVTPEEKKTVLSEVKGIEKDIASIQQLLRKTWNWRMAIPLLTPLVTDDILQWKASIEVLFQIRDKVLDILKRLQIIQENTANLRNAITMSVDAHTLNEVIMALARSKGRTYDEYGNLILVKKVGDHEIRMNLSSAVRIYQKGLQILEEKETVLHEMKQRYFDEYVEDFEMQKRKLMNKINDMEQNPWAYQHLLGHFTYDAEQVHVLRRIEVHESIPPMDPMIPHIFETMFSYYEQEISKGKKLIATIKKSFEEFFEQDQNVSKIFDLRYG
ncbi:DUF6792 domain-containing protein [Parageobacillus thermoglucosidasius]|uniref:DUF6792 domain-containing protein n=1 Tax=Parageobacillus thermoglucosidasius TaxID=1426 RepID=A0A1B7KQF5_PARTM|nr:DUF6792 domain-containing protein [Parageobacillus thermoglucosidasius]OAT72323.1 hypothetical protein A7K69_09315 [Parageobacillus thermoglucosidasius]